MEKGLIFNIQKFSIHDGPGIRTTVFFKGCPLKCKWCSNPESQLHKLQILYDFEKCAHCKKCLLNCPKQAITEKENHMIFNHDKCIGCLQCVNHCPTKALSHEGDFKEIQEIVDVCMQDIDFYEESNGGVTISGGEGMAQPEFLEKLVLSLKEKNLHVAIETTGYIQQETFQKLAPLFDLLLFDVKHYDRLQHFEGTGVYNDLIVENLQWAIQHQLNVLPRIPVIPDFNDSLEDAQGISDLLKALNIQKVQLLPFHQFGEKKYDLLNKEYSLKTYQAYHEEDLKDYQQIFLDKGIDCVF